MRRDDDGIAVLTIRRPAVLNALNEEVFDQIGRHLEDVAGDEAIRGVVLTGFGRKAFVSGADVSILARISSAEEGEGTSLGSQSVLLTIENFSKPVVCAYNGLAFGGGNELGMACHARLARKGLDPLAAQPEPNLGIIPGAGATQRLPRLIGLESAWTLLRTGRPISSAEALKLGLIRGRTRPRRRQWQNKARPIEKDPIAVPDELPDVDIGHLSRAVDAVLQKAIREGNRMSLDEGLRFEAKCFGEICALRDMRIGVDNFVRNGPRKKASFVHQ